MWLHHRRVQVVALGSQNGSRLHQEGQAAPSRSIERKSRCDNDSANRCKDFILNAASRTFGRSRPGYVSRSLLLSNMSPADVDVPIPRTQFYSAESKTPPPKDNAQPTVPKLTLLRTSLPSTDPFTSTHALQNDTFLKGAQEMVGKFAKISVANFLHFLPSHDGMPKVKRGKFKWLRRRETSLDDPFVRLSSLLADTCSNCFADSANETYLNEGWVFVNTSNHSDPDSHNLFGPCDIKPDISLYSPEAMHAPSRPCQAAKMESFGEFKVDMSDEPFHMAKSSAWRGLVHK